MKKIPKDVIVDTVRRALREDVGSGDVTAKFTVSKDMKVTAECVAKEDMVVCGVDVARVVFKMVDENVKFRACCKDGELIKKGQLIYRVSGSANSIVSAERVSINFIGHLSGIASKSYKLQEIARPYGVTLLDTRKTTPNLRLFEKYAVRCGGAGNHRMGLFDMFLVKENHLFSAGIKTKDLIDAGKLKELVKKMKQKTKLKVEIEVDNIRELKATLSSGCDIILLDNFTPAQIRKAVALRDKGRNRIKLEASGGISEKNLINYIKTGVDYVSMGALTHSVRCSDVSLNVGG